LPRSTSRSTRSLAIRFFVSGKNGIAAYASPT